MISNICTKRLFVIAGNSATHLNNYLFYSYLWKHFSCKTAIF